jgi:hypothetical protein
VLTVLGLVAATVMVGAAQVRGQGDDVAYVRLVGALPVDNMLDMSLDGEAVFENLEYQDVGTYEAVTAGTRVLRLTPHEGGEPVLEGEVELVADVYYTIVVTGTPDEVEGHVFEDDLTAPDAGTARLRLVHVTPQVGAVHLLASDGSPLAEGLVYGDASEYIATAAGLHDLTVRDADSGDDLITATDLELVDGHVYTAFFMGVPGDDPGLALVTAVDAAPPGVGEFALYFPAVRNR